MGHSASMSYVDIKDVVGAAPTGDVPVTSEWSTISLPTKVRLWWHVRFIPLQMWYKKCKRD